MSKRPDNIIYWVNEKPPLGMSILMGLQHVFIMSSTLALPVVIVKEIGGSMLEIAGVVGLSMIAAGLGTILQALKKGPMGSGYLCPNLCGPSYLAVSVQAAWLGGLPLMHGMIMLAGVFEAFFSRVVHRLKFLFPSEVTGVVVLMVGVALIPLGSSKFLGIQIAGDPINPLVTSAAVLTLLVMIGLNIWTKGRLHLYSVLVGMVVAYLASSLLGILDQDDWQRVWEASWFALPGHGMELFRYDFDWTLVVPFLVVSLCGSLKTFGNLITCQHINDDDWREPDMKSIGNGLLADAVSVFSGGLLGGVAADTSASNVGLSAATGVTSRGVAFAAGGIYIALAFCPKLTTLVGIMPPPAMGAILLFVTSFMIIAAIKIILTTPATTRKTFVVGIALIFGLSVDILPQMYSHIHPWIKPLFSSSLTLATVMAILLNQLFSLGASKEG
ncbi:MAG: solute carrier family 23 protein [Desulfofustis sp.]